MSIIILRKDRKLPIGYPRSTSSQGSGIFLVGGKKALGNGYSNRPNSDPGLSSQDKNYGVPEYVRT